MASKGMFTTTSTSMVERGSPQAQGCHRSADQVVYPGGSQGFDHQVDEISITQGLVWRQGFISSEGLRRCCR